MQAADRIRNVALVGHRGSGKTSLHEALLHEAGATTRLGSVADGTTISDSDDDEKARGMSISASLASFEWRDVKVNLVDTPGEPSFIADALGALRVCESAVFVVNGVLGVEVGTQRLWQRAQELGVARLVYVNMLDRERADFFRVLDALKDAFGPHVVATEIPIGSEHDTRGLIDLVDMKAYEYADGSCTEVPIPDELAEQAQEYREKLMDEVAENSDALMERYLEGEEISHDEIVTALEDGTDHGHIFPVTCGVATSRLGSDRLLDAIVDDLPSPGPARRPRAREHDARARPERRDVRLRLQDPRRPLRGPHQPLPGLPGHGQARHARAQHAHPSQGAHRAAAGPAGQGLQADRGVRARRHRRRRQAQGDARRRLAGGARRAGPDALGQAPRAGDGVRDGAEVQGRRGQGLHRSAAPPGGGPDHRPAPRHADRRADRGRAVADPRRGDRRAHAPPLRRRGHAQAAAGALPGDDPGRRQGARPAQEADRRARPVRRLPHRDRAAARTATSSSSTRSRAASSRTASSPRSRRACSMRCRPARSPAIRSRACA